MLGLSGVNYRFLLDLRDALVSPTSEVRVVARREIIIMEGYRIRQDTDTKLVETRELLRTFQEHPPACPR